MSKLYTPKSVRVIWAIGGVKAYKQGGKILGITDWKVLFDDPYYAKVEAVEHILKDRGFPYIKQWAESKQFPGTIMYRFIVDENSPRKVTNDDMDKIQFLLNRAGLN